MNLVIFPEILVERNDLVIKRVVWDPKRSGELPVDITNMYTMKVEAEIAPDGPPMVKITLLARLVELESDDPRAEDVDVPAGDADL